jgi:hypothetical protein
VIRWNNNIKSCLAKPFASFLRRQESSLFLQGHADAQAHERSCPCFLITQSPNHLITLSPFHRSTFWIVSIIMLCFPQLSCTKRLANVYPLEKTYYNESTLHHEMQQLAKNNAGFVELLTIGYTAKEQKPLYALQIQTDMERTPVLIVGQHHGDEVMGVEIAMALAKYLANAKTDTKVKQLLETYSFWIVPTLNPEAYAIVTSGKHEWKRKNNTDTSHNGKLDIKTDGVDLNRNYSTFWKLDAVQSQGSLFYKGMTPASENETKAISELAAMHRFRYAFFYHSSVSGAFNEKIFLPWQDKRDKQLKPDFVTMRELAEVYASAVPRDYVPGNYIVHPGNTSKIGNARNHFYYEYGTFAFDIEVCGANKSGIGIVHPASETREKVVQKNMQAIIKTLIYAVGNGL